MIHLLLFRGPAASQILHKTCTPLKWEGGVDGLSEGFEGKQRGLLTGAVGWASKGPTLTKLHL